MRGARRGARRGSRSGAGSGSRRRSRSGARSGSRSGFRSFLHHISFLGDSADAVGANFFRAYSYFLKLRITSHFVLVEPGHSGQAGRRVVAGVRFASAFHRFDLSSIWCRARVGPVLWDVWTRQRQLAGHVINSPTQEALVLVLHSRATPDFNGRSKADESNG